MKILQKINLALFISTTIMGLSGLIGFGICFIGIKCAPLLYVGTLSIFGLLLYTEFSKKKEKDDEMDN